MSWTSVKRFAWVLVVWMPASVTYPQGSDPVQQRGDSQDRSDRGTTPFENRWGSNEDSSQQVVAEHSPIAEPPSQKLQVGPKPIVTRQRAFSIPFTLSSTQDQDQPAEVRLYVSGDQGARWSLYQRQSPGADRFHFRAAQDGEFWFMVRTVANSDEPVALQNHQPELVVIVDTAQPQLQLAAVAGEYGGVRVDWQATDPNLAAHTFRLEYLDGLDGDWQRVNVEVPTPEDWRQEFTGTADWWIKSSASNARIRAEILDRAGNSLIAAKTVVLQKVAADTQSGAAGLVASDEVRQIGSENPAENDPPNEAAASSRDWWRRGPKQDDAAVSSQNAATWSSPFSTVSEVARRPPTDASSDLPPEVTASTQDGFAGTSQSSGYGSTLDRREVETYAIGDAPNRPTPSEIAPPVADRQHPDSVVPSWDVKPRMTSSPRFQLEYDLIDVGPNGVTRVELWYTADKGRTWQLYDHDPDNQSPIDVRMQREGFYGFAIVVYSDGAAAPRPPQDGDDPDLLVGVDWTKPAARITSAQHIGNERRTLVEIQWQASDAWLGERPIDLSFSEQPGGPWSAIASGLPNSGRYEWQIDRKPPSHLYLRLKVRDEAGNVTMHELAQPLIDETRSPKGRIRNLRPINEVTTRPIR